MWFGKGNPSKNRPKFGFWVCESLSRYLHHIYWYLSLNASCSKLDLDSSGVSLIGMCYRLMFDLWIIHIYQPPANGAGFSWAWDVRLYRHQHHIPAAPPAPVADMHWPPYHFAAPAPEAEPRQKHYQKQHHILIRYNMIALQIDCTKLHTRLLHLKTHTIHFRICIFGVSIVVCMNCLIYHRFSMYFSVSTDCLWFFCFRQCLQLASTSTSRSNKRLLSLVRLMISCKHHDAVIDDEWMWI